MTSEPDISTLDEVLDLASEIIDENAPDPQGTRLERLAGWISKNVGCEPDTSRLTTPRLEVDFYRDVVVWRASQAHFAMTPEEARVVAVALLRAAEAAES